jgi:hypothetical protein
MPPPPPPPPCIPAPPPPPATTKTSTVVTPVGTVKVPGALKVLTVSLALWAVVPTGSLNLPLIVVFVSLAIFSPKHSLFCIYQYSLSVFNSLLNIS